MDKRKLNLGSGKNYLDDAVNVDIAPGFNPDVVADMRDIEFPEAQFTEILANDSLEKITLREARVLARKMLRWLRPNGVLKIHTVNMPHCCRLAVQGDHEALRWLYATDGEGTTDYPSNIVRWAYSPQSLSKLLVDVGFKVLQANPDCNGYGLSMVAVKPSG